MKWWVRPASQDDSRFLVPFMAYAFLNNFIPYLAILPFIYAQLSFTTMQMSTITVLGNVLITLLEIPTGSVADRYGRKASTLMGIAFIAAGILFVLLSSKTFAVMLSWMVFQAIGVTLISGADRALLFDTLKEHAQENQYQMICGRFMGLARVSGFLATAVAGVLFKAYGFNVLLIIALAAKAGAFLCILCVTSESSRPRAEKPSYRSVVRLSLTHITRNRVLAYGIALYAILGATGIAWEYRSLLFSTKMTNDPSIVAGLTSITTVIYALALYGSGWVRPILQRDRYRLSFLLVPLAILAATLLPRFLGLAALLVYVFLGGALLPFNDALLNAALKQDELRATVLSTASLVRSTVYSLVVLMFGRLGKYGVATAMAVTSGVLFLICGILLSVGRTTDTGVAPSEAESR